MNWTGAITIFAVAFTVSWAGVGLFRKWSLRRELFDVPNERSSHTIPTPRGAGLVIVLVCLAAYALLGVGLGDPFSWGYFVGAMLVAAISWLDDLRSIPSWVRLSVHILAASVLVYDLGIWSEIYVPLVSQNLELGGVLGSIVTVAWIVWMINAYNFMDGIDGIAGLQAVVTAAAWGILSAVLHPDGFAVYTGVILFACLGFLIHNWQPAKVFMGDVGSAFLGFTLASLPLLFRLGAPPNLEQWLPTVGLLFLWFFVFDSVSTLIRRAIRGEKVWTPHREHFYQRLVIRGWQHSKVSLVYGAAAALLSTSVILGIFFSGIFGYSAIFFFVVLTLAIVSISYQKNVDASS